MELLGRIMPYTVALTDATSPCDELLGSPLGASDGQVYRRFLAQVFSAPGCFERATWWKNIYQ